MAQSNQRLVLDLDDIERQLKEAQLPPSPPKSDPLAELARIVGQNDPFRTLIAGERQGRSPAPLASADEGVLAITACLVRR